MVATTTAASSAPLQRFALQADTARGIAIAHGLCLQGLDETVVDWYLFYFSIITNAHFQVGEDKRGQVASRLVREELAEVHGQEVVDSNDLLIRTACKYASILLQEAFEQLDSTGARAEAEALRQRQIDHAMSKVDQERATRVFGQAISAYFTAARGVNRLDSFSTDEEGGLQFETFQAVAYRRGHAAIREELGASAASHEVTTKKGLGLANALMKAAMKEVTASPRPKK